MELKLMYSKGEILVHESCTLSLEDLYSGTGSILGAPMIILIYFILILQSLYIIACLLRIVTAYNRCDNKIQEEFYHSGLL